MKLLALFVAVLAWWSCSQAAGAEAAQAGSGGGALESQTLSLAVPPGAQGVTVSSRPEAWNKRAELLLVPSGAAEPAPISRAEANSGGPGGGALRVTAGSAEAILSLGSGPFVKIVPGKNAGAIEVRTGARYAVLPDFFADDVVFSPQNIASSKLTVPAENFLLQFIEGGDAIVMCIWPGNLKPPSLPQSPSPPREGVGGGPASPGQEEHAAGSKVEKEGPDPQVDLLFAGEDKERRVSAARIEFQGKPVYVGIIERKGIWHEQDVSAMPAYKPGPITWQRPCEARWRGDFVLAPGKSLSDWPGQSQSFDFQNTRSPRTDTWWKRGADPLDARFAAAASNSNPLKWIEKGDENAPQIWQESLAAFFIYPAFFRGDEVRLCLYADKGERNKARQATEAARKANKDAPEVLPPNVYERVLIYPLGRVPATPLSLFTPVDLMRETLGSGPCEYVLDLAGVQPRPAGGDRPILSYATCGLWNDHIFPLIRKLKKKPDGSFEPLEEKDKAHLVQALEDMWYFVRTVHDRLREYKKWGASLATFCEQQAAAKAPVKQVAGKIMVRIARLNSDLSHHRFEGPGSEAYWKDRIPELIKMVKADQYAEVNSIAKIRDLGNDQDERVSRCRQYVKAARQEILLQDTSDPEVRSFAAEVRDRCHAMLRNMHPKEGF